MGAHMNHDPSGLVGCAPTHPNQPTMSDDEAMNLALRRSLQALKQRHADAMMMVDRAVKVATISESILAWLRENNATVKFSEHGHILRVGEDVRVYPTLEECIEAHIAHRR